tara:strand:- start:273 stop:518 length:246 start_codon:yes stop_codon:yes gene_type:complete
LFDHKKYQVPRDTLVKKRSVLIAGHSTSISLEEAFWRELKLISKARNVSLNKIITEIDKSRTGNLSSSIRVFVLAQLKLNL